MRELEGQGRWVDMGARSRATLKHGGMAPIPPIYENSRIVREGYARYPAILLGYSPLAIQIFLFFPSAEQHGRAFVFWQIGLQRRGRGQQFPPICHSGIESGACRAGRLLRPINRVKKESRNALFWSFCLILRWAQSAPCHSHRHCGICKSKTCTDRS